MREIYQQAKVFTVPRAHTRTQALTQNDVMRFKPPMFKECVCVQSKTLAPV